MKQQINLYEKLFPTIKTSSPTLALVAVCLVLELVVVGVIAVLLDAEIDVQAMKRDALKNAYQLESAAYATFAKSSKTNQKLADVTERIAALDKEIASRQKLVRKMEHLTAQGLSGFSLFITQLNDTVTSGVSLQTIRVYDFGNALHFSGQLSSAQRLPIWLDKLGQQSAYQGKTFEQLVALKNDDSQLMQFELGARQQ